MDEFLKIVTTKTNSKRECESEQTYSIKLIYFKSNHKPSLDYFMNKSYQTLKKK